MTLESIIIQYSWRAVGRIYSGNHATLEGIYSILLYSVYIGRIYTQGSLPGVDTYHPGPNPTCLGTIWIDALSLAFQFTYISYFLFYNAYTNWKIDLVQR